MFFKTQKYFLIATQNTHVPCESFFSFLYLCMRRKVKFLVGLVIECKCLCCSAFFPFLLVSKHEKTFPDIQVSNMRTIFVRFRMYGNPPTEQNKNKLILEKNDRSLCWRKFWTSLFKLYNWKFILNDVFDFLSVPF